jgi:thiosulfate dehydrogenase [quinone] large subunit
VIGRRQALLASVGTLGLLALDGLRFGALPAVLAKSVGKAFHPPAGARKIGNIKRLAIGAGIAITNPATGGPAIVVRLSKTKQVKAYSAVCTHAGCTVAYYPSRRLVVCPCHGSVYDPAHGAAVVSGPAPYPLPALKAAVDPHGNIWVA